MRVMVTLVSVLLFTTGCGLIKPKPEIEYREIPAGYLQPCPLPPAPLNNGQLSEAFVVAMKCAEQGNKDKARIKALL